jgi:imidazolonepropionase-like amidohydrolase
MQKTLVTALFLAIATSVLLFSCTAPRSSVLAITHVAVIDATGAPPRSDQTVLIDKEKIVELDSAASIAIPRGAKILDATGKVLIPGLIDSHIHLTGAGEPGGSRDFMIPLLLANGITSVRDMGGYLESLVPLRDQIRKGDVLGPQIVFAGPYLDGSPPSFRPSLVVTNSVQASEDVRMLMRQGVDFIKVQSHLSRDAYFAIAEVAKREHITFVGHVPDRVMAREAADAGQKSIEHLTNVLRGCSGDEAKLIREQFYVLAKKETPAQSRARQLRWDQELLSSFSKDACQSLIAEFVKDGTWQTPTLILLKNDAFPTARLSLKADWRTKYVPKKLLAVWTKAYEQQMAAVTPAESILRQRLLQQSMLIVGDMQRNGVKILAGTDSAAPFVFPGSSLHEELALLVRSGLSPMEALQAATRNPSEFLKQFAEQGTIEKGKLADLALLDANPLDDIRHTQKIRAVILRGKLLDRSALDALLAHAQDYAANH